MQEHKDSLPNKTHALKIVTSIAMEIMKSAEMSPRKATIDEVYSIPVFEEHMKDIAKEYQYEPCLHYIFTRPNNEFWMLHKGMFYLWFRKNIPTFKKLTRVSPEFTRVVMGFENMNGYIYKYTEMITRGGGRLKTTDEMTKEMDLLWNEYKQAQMELFPR